MFWSKLRLAFRIWRLKRQARKLVRRSFVLRQGLPGGHRMAEMLCPEYAHTRKRVIEVMQTLEKIDPHFPNFRPDS